MERIISLALIVTMLGTGLVKAQTSAPAYPESDEGLAQLMKDVLAAAGAKDRAKLSELVRSLILPNYKAWFDDTFGDEKGPKMAAEYEVILKNLEPSLVELFMRLDAPAQLQVQVMHVENMDDPKTTAYQRFALAAMKNPAALYTARISKEGTNANITLWSIVYAEGAFRFVGKMKAAKD